MRPAPLPTVNPGCRTSPRPYGERGPSFPAGFPVEEATGWLRTAPPRRSGRLQYTRRSTTLSQAAGRALAHLLVSPLGVHPWQGGDVLGGLGNTARS
jgi:hypothetical protein